MFKKIKKEELRVPASIEHLKDLRKFIEKIGKKHRIPDKIVNSFKLAIDEASTNIIRHAYRDSSGEILLRVIIRKTSVTVSLIDHGRFFDPNNVKDPDLKRYVAIGKRGGLGIFMIRKLVDDIEYYRTGEGNELRLTKKIEKKRKAKISVPSIPGSLRIKYYSYSAAILSTLIILGYFYFFFQRSEQILDQTFAQGEAAVKVLAKNSTNWIGTAAELNLNKEVKVILTQNPKLLTYAVVVDKNGVVKGSTDFDLFRVFKPYSGVVTEKVFGEERALVRLPNGEKEYMISKPIYVIDHTVPNSKRFMGRAYVFISSRQVNHWIHQKRTDDLRVALLLLLFGNIGVALLITLIISPFRKLASWVRNASEGNIEDEMEIDSSDEIGEIAQAFNEITYKFRKSQQSLQDQERLKHEMHLAQEIQQTLLPAKFPKRRGFEISSYYESAKEVGGDYYDFVEIDPDRLGVVIADVSGKGVPGSLVMTMIRTALRTEARGTYSAAETLRKVNRFIMGDIKKGMFVTVFYTILNSRNRSLTYASAGHNPMILYRPSTKKTYYLNPRGFPVGISLNDEELFDKSLEDDSIRLAKGDIVIIYTDGVTEAMNSRRELFGEERLLEAVRRYGNLSAEEFVAKLREEIVSFTEGQIQYDDISLVVIKENMDQEEEYEERAREAYYQVLNGVSATQACKNVGLSFNTFKKYKEKFEEVGVDNFRSDYEATAVEAKHLSIEEQTKIFDIIKKHPDYGPRRIAELLATDTYGNMTISENRVYGELVRLKLNTKQLRENFVVRNKHKRKFKPPGTPMLTLDGRVIIDNAPAKLSAPILREPEEESSVEKTEEFNGETLSAEIEEITSTEGLGLEVGEAESAQEKPPRPRAKRREEKSLMDEDIEEIILSDPVDVFDKNKGMETEPEEELLGDENDEEKTDLSEIEGIEVLERTHARDVSNMDSDKIESSKKEMDLDQREESGTSLKKLFESLNMAGDGEDVSESESGEEELDLLQYSILEDGDLLEEGEFSDQGMQADKTESEPATGEIPPAEEIFPNGNSEKSDEEPEPEISLEKIFGQLSVQGEEDVEDRSVQENFNRIEDLVDNIIVEEEEIEGVLESEDTEKIQEKQKTIPKKEIDEASKVKRLLLTGLRFYLDKDFKKAIAVFKKIIDEYPDHFEAHYNLGNAYFRMKDFDKAEREYLKVIEIDPSFTDAHENLGVIYANRKDFKKAIQIWKKILEIKPDRKDVKKNIEKALKLSKSQKHKETTTTE
ncbi:MAG: SpoIIE family protein phosphatase [Calditrichaeota bacterium]|nr:SpoIIE family protein phosphatase [Calditrichota bacterium]